VESLDADRGAQVDTANPRLFILSDRDGAKLYVYYRRIPGCGGACEGDQLVVSEAPLRQPQSAATGH
jgi:hypothetical protein